MRHLDFSPLSAGEIAARLSDGTLSPADIARGVIERHARLEPDLRAWSWFEPRQIERAYRDGPAPTDPRPGLLGVPVGVKDIIDVEGMPTGLGLPGAATPAARHAACVELLRAAGAVPVGKTVTAELAFSHPGPTRNPHGPGHTPGGSSSGSAAAVAAGMVPLALGTQTGGSVIRPAAYCGVVGIKTSLNAVPSAGIAPVADSLDCVGWFARSVEDAILAARVLLPWQDLAPRRPGNRLRVWRLDAMELGTLSPEARQALDEASAALRGAGCAVVEAPLAGLLPALAECHRRIMLHELARTLLPILCTRGRELSAAMLKAIDAGRSVTASQYQEARHQVREAHAALDARMRDFDLILTPSAAGEAPAGLHHTGDSTFNRVWSVLGWPAIHLPTAWSPRGLPVGVQLVGRQGEDEALLRHAQALHPLIDRRMPASRAQVPMAQ
ncbi:amidase [Pigmentiphaga sp. H8]|uniref:amidase n=1 Tax=Pigmentiphaga sp. H8 TaxID=2488560 RepID=UPI000F59A28F|nr:amidase [Pigmentiphaga sp. H8]AZG07574.1 amidase [Pigmentiphaga sp. H8]